MQTVYILSIFLSIFCHCMGFFYCPVEATSDSCVFIIVATMALNKFKLMTGLMTPVDTVANIQEFVTLCLSMQILLLVVWYPVYYVLQVLADIIAMNCVPSGIADDIIQGYGATVCVLAIELAVLLNWFGIDDVQRFYGSKDDLVSDSTLSIVTAQQKIAMRRKNMLRMR